MIQLTCTNCGALMSIDDAFAGGVCRCLECKAIQTVPSRNKLKAVTGPVPKPLPSRQTLTPSTAIGSGTGLEELGALVSSGGFGSSHRPRPKPTPRTESHTPAMRTVLPVVLGGVALLVALIVGGVLLLHNDDNEPQRPAVPQVILDMTLPDAGAVLYVVDLGPSFAENRTQIAGMVGQSIKTLGQGRPVQVVLAGDAPSLMFSAAPVAVTSGTAQDVIRRLNRLDQVAGNGGEAALAAALITAESIAAQGKPHGIVVLISGEAWQVSDELLDVSISQVPIYTVAVGGDHYDGTFARLAEQTGGKSQVLSAAELRSSVWR